MLSVRPFWNCIVPNPGSVVINELLAHSHADAPDWIELYNTTDAAINIGGWFLSDSNSILTKYRIATGTSIAPYGYMVFYEDQHFDNQGDPGSLTGFALSEDGERLYMSSGQDGLLTGYRDVEDFGASETGVSFGRYFKSSTGNYNFVAMSQTTDGAANAYPKVGPVVISEIMYNPDWPVGGSYTDDQYEYIELCNISSEPVTLYSNAMGLAWKFTDGIDFTFPKEEPVTIPAGGYLLVAKHPAAFSWRYPEVPVENIFGPFDGSLNNAGESVELSMPGGNLPMCGQGHGKNPLASSVLASRLLSTRTQVPRPHFAMLVISDILPATWLLVKPSLVNSFSSPDCIIRICHKIFFPRSSQV